MDWSFLCDMPMMTHYIRPHVFSPWCQNAWKHQAHQKRWRKPHDRFPHPPKKTSKIVLSPGCNHQEGGHAKTVSSWRPRPRKFIVLGRGAAGARYFWVSQKIVGEKTPIRMAGSWCRSVRIPFGNLGVNRPRDHLVRIGCTPSNPPLVVGCFIDVDVST